VKNPRKLEVFVGSTSQDLEKERTEIVKAIQKAGHIPNAMELWTPSPLATKDDIGQRLDGCDIHILIVKARYGHTPDVEERDNNVESISITEWEYMQSVKAKRPVIAFLLHDDLYPKARKAEVKRDPGEANNNEKLGRFRDQLKKRVCRFFGKRGTNLTTDCIAAINEVVNRDQVREHAGWIRASSDDAKLAPNGIIGN
jgi:hypothetical protein